MGQSHQNPPNNAESESTIPPSKEKSCDKNEKNYKQKKTSNTNTEKHNTKPNMSKSQHQKVVAAACLIKENRLSCNTVEQEFVNTIESTHSIISSNIGMESEVKVIKS